jgi:hypothetical protein
MPSSYRRLNTEGRERDVPNIADYSIWYLQLPLKKKLRRKEPADTNRATCPLYNYPDMAKLSYRRSFTLGIKCDSCDFMGKPSIGGSVQKKSCSSPGSWFQLLLNEHKRMIGQGRHGNNSSSEVKKITEELAPPIRPIPKVIPGLHHRLSVLMLGLWYVTQLHYLYRALPFGCTDKSMEQLNETETVEIY